MLKLQLIAGILLFSLLTACGDGSSGSSEFHEASYIEHNKELIKNRLKDPNSAEFKNVFVSNKMGAPIVCGEVNAKNGFGGYTSFQRFISGGDIQVTETDMAAGEMDKSWQQICGK